MNLQEQISRILEMMGVSDENGNITLSDVQDFFLKNTEFANKIYEILDFNQDNKIKEYLNKLKNFKRITGKKSVRLVDKETGESVSYEIDIINMKGRVTYQLEELQKNKGKKISLGDSKFKDAGIYAYLDFFINNQDKDIVVGDILSGRGINVLDRLESLGMVTRTNASVEGSLKALKSDNDHNYFFSYSPYRYNRDFLKNLEKNSLTPSQKNVAQKMYYNFLMAKNYKNIEMDFDGFSKFIKPIR